MAAAWIETFAFAYVVLCLVSAAAVGFDVLRGRRHPMEVMNWVWPITALYVGPLAFLLHRRDLEEDSAAKPFGAKVFTGVTHCASGCALGDLAGEWIVFGAAMTIAGHTLAAAFVMDFALAYVIGIAFQYFSIAPMRGISGWRGIAAALKADTLSLIAFEVGMFGWMALVRLVLFPDVEANSFLYWFLMQIGMTVGFATSYPANWWLLRKGWKEAM